MDRLLKENIKEVINSNKELIDKQREGTVFTIDNSLELKVLDKNYYSYKCEIYRDLFRFLFNNCNEELLDNPFCKNEENRIFLYKDRVYEVKLLGTDELNDTKLEVVFEILNRFKLED